MVRDGNTATTAAPVLGPLRRFTRVVVPTDVPGSNPPGTRVGVLVGVPVTLGVGVVDGVVTIVAVGGTVTVLRYGLAT